jgi:hypothetical protein
MRTPELFLPCGLPAHTLASGIQTQSIVWTYRDISGVKDAVLMIHRVCSYVRSFFDLCCLRQTQLISHSRHPVDLQYHVLVCFPVDLLAMYRLQSAFRSTL